jgi:type IV pilus assembly protein PilB
MAFMDAQGPIPYDIDPKILKLIPKAIALKYTVIPLRREGQTLYLGTDDPRNRATLEDLEFMSGFRVHPVEMGTRSIVEALRANYDLNAEEEASLARLLATIDKQDSSYRPDGMMGNGEFGTIVHEMPYSYAPEELEPAKASVPDQVESKLLQGILDQGMSPDVDAILFEPTVSGMQVRLRRGDMLVHELDLPLHEATELMSFIARLTDQVTDQERGYRYCGSYVHKRDGESVTYLVRRLQAVDGILAVFLPIHDFDVRREQERSEGAGWAKVAAMYSRPPALVIFVSPPGHGKTTALCNFAAHVLQTGQLGVMVSTRPRWRLPGVQLVPVAGGTREEILGVLERVRGSRPELLLVDEPEYPAVPALIAESRHVLTGIALRGIDPLDVLLHIGAQNSGLTLSAIRLAVYGLRLVDLLCPKCKQRVQLKPRSVGRLQDLGLKLPAEVYAPRGCAACHGTGYSGRELVIQSLRPTPELMSMAKKGGRVQEMRTVAKRAGMISLTSCVLPLLEAGKIGYMEARSLTHGFVL